VFIISPTKEIAEVQALLDQGSEISLISEHIVQQLPLSRSRSSIPLVGIGAQRSNNTKGATTVQLKDRHNKFNFSIQAHILRKLTSVPSAPINTASWPHLRGLQLADLDFLSPQSADLILGADIQGVQKVPIQLNNSQDKVISKNVKVIFVVTFNEEFNGDLGFDLDDDLQGQLYFFKQNPPFLMSTIEKAGNFTSKNVLSS